MSLRIFNESTDLLKPPATSYLSPPRGVMYYPQLRYNGRQPLPFYVSHCGRISSVHKDRGLSLPCVVCYCRRLGRVILLDVHTIRPRRERGRQSRDVGPPIHLCCDAARWGRTTRGAVRLLGTSGGDRAFHRLSDQTGHLSMKRPHRL